MKKLNLFSQLLFILLLSSCSPQIKSNFVKRYPSASNSEELKIYNPEEYNNSIRSKNEFLGTILVYDSGFTTNCSFDKMLQIVKDSTRANGGNIIGLTQHKKPSFFGSSCHQFEADILKQKSQKQDLLAIYPNQDSIQDNAFENLKEVVTHPFLFSTNVGPSILIGKKDNTSEFTKAIHEKVKTGTQFSFSGLYRFNKKEAIGLKYNYTYRSGKVDNAYVEFSDFKPTEYGDFNIETHLNYFGLKFYNEYPFGNNKNRFSLDSSVGYFSYKEISGIDTIFTVTSGSLGFDFYTGYERAINEQFAIGLNLGIFYGAISKFTITDGQATEEIHLDRENRINLASINFGLNFSYRL